MATITQVRTKPLVPQDLPPIKVEEEDDIAAARQANLPLPPPSKRPTEVLSVDKGTPDHHVPRDPRLLRLTGVHPFNVEPPLTALYKEGSLSVCLIILSSLCFFFFFWLHSDSSKGFLTTPELFYVRNHGAVPQVQDDEILNWEISIEG